MERTIIISFLRVKNKIYFLLYHLFKKSFFFKHISSHYSILIVANLHGRHLLPQKLDYRAGVFKILFLSVFEARNDLHSDVSLWILTQTNKGNNNNDFFVQIQNKNNK